MDIRAEEYLKYTRVYEYRNKVNEYKEKILGNNLSEIISLFRDIGSSFRQVLNMLDGKYTSDFFNNTHNINEENLKGILHIFDKYLLSETLEENINIVGDIEIGNDDFSKDIILCSKIEVLFNGKVTLNNAEEKLIKNCTFQSNVIFPSNIGINGLKFEDCIFDGNIVIKKKFNSIHSISFINCIFNADIKFEEFTGGDAGGGKYNGKLFFTNSNFKKLSFNHVKFSELKIEFDKDFKVKEGYENNVSLERVNFSKIRIAGEDIKNRPNIGEFNIFHCKFSKESEVYISYIMINNFNIASTTNLTDAFKITNVKIKKEFKIEDVDFGKIIFNGLDLEDAKLNFKHPTFNNCIFNSITWSKDCEIKNENDDELRDIYRQMKHVMDKSGDSITGSKFYRNEMDIQRKLIKKSGKTEKLVFWFGYNVNNFGQDWFRPLLILFIVNFIFWLLSKFGIIGFLSLIYDYIYFIGLNLYEKIKLTLTFSLNNKLNVSGLFSDFSSYISYLTPFRKLEQNPNLWDILARIISALLIYQSAIAMRRKIER
ncbi:MAG: hypothetical protein PHH06_02675 [Candidatus Gracilibacteria bacterium]|nr:hypothetical protein [Candidatus Gracilibacteria bacterium]